MGINVRPLSLYLCKNEYVIEKNVDEIVNALKLQFARRVSECVESITYEIHLNIFVGKFVGKQFVNLLCS